MSGGFDYFMLHHGAGTEEKFATLTDGEFRAHIAGVLAVAAKSPIRGYLLVGEIEAQPVHVARKAGVTERVAKSAIRKLREVGVLVRDAEVGAWRVHNWEQHQSERRDPTAAKRAAEYRARRAADSRSSRDASRDDHGEITSPITDESRSPSREARGRAPGLPEGVEEEVEETPPQPLASEGSRERDPLSVKRAERARAGSRRRVDLQALAAEEQAQAAAHLQPPQPGDAQSWGRLAEALRDVMAESTWCQRFESLTVVARDGETLLVGGGPGLLEQHRVVLRRVAEQGAVSVRAATPEEVAAAEKFSALAIPNGGSTS